MPNNQLYVGEAKPEPRGLSEESDSAWASSLKRVPTLAIYTLAALAAQDLSHQALANPAVGLSELPQLNEASNVVRSEQSETTTSDRSRNAVASPESISVQEFAPESSVQIEATETQLEAQPVQQGQKAVGPTVGHSASLATNISIAPPEADVILGRTSTSVQKERSPLAESAPLKPSSVVAVRSDAIAQPAVPQIASATSLANLQRPSARDLLDAPTTEPRAIASSQPNTTTQDTGVAVAQATPTTSRQDVEQLQNDLRAIEDIKVNGDFQASPALSVVIPTAFGLDKNTGFISGSFQSRTRYTNQADGGLGIGIGLGDAQKAVGVELSYALASFGGSRDFGSGGFNAKVHRQLPNGFAVAAGWNGFLNVGGDNDFENSVYGVVSKIIKTREDINQPFSRVALTAGVGSGQFRSEDAAVKDSDGVNVFGNVAVRVARPVSVIAEWSGQDLGVGLSIAPFKNIPLVITPAVRDIVGAGDGPRFVLGTGLAFKF
ncbi:MAG TPA: hypothetical protein V6D50_00330 [Chroococcales cyanobacterium]